MSEGRSAKAGAGPPRLFLRLLESSDLPAPVLEHKFAKGRKWRFDLAWPQYGVALEVQGGTWRKTRRPCPRCSTPVSFTAGGAHAGAGAIRDYEKFSEAAARGWLLIQVTPDGLCTGQTIDWVERALKTRGHRARIEA